jgi:signal transduction histidine kinase
MPDIPHVAAEPDFRVLFESSPGLHLVLDPTLRIVAVTDAYLRATMTRREDILRRGLFEVFPDNPDDPAATGARNLRTSLERVLHHKVADTMAVQQYDIRKPDGQFEVRFWSPINLPVLDASGRVIWIIHRVEDVSDFVRLKQHNAEQAQQSQELRDNIDRMEVETFKRAAEIQATNKRLDEANQQLQQLYERTKMLERNKSEFLSLMSHELRTPLNAIIGFTGTLLMLLPGPLNADQYKQLQTIQRSARHLLSLINDLLDVAKVEAGKMELRIERLNCQAVLREAADLQRDAAHDKGLEFRLTMPAADIIVIADQRALSQIVLNLLSNAIKFTARGTVEMVLDTASSAAGNFARICVRDTGAGIGVEDQTKLFDAFMQARDASTRCIEGTGLGLYVSQKLAALMGAHIEVSSTPGVGSMFTLVVPGTA